MIWVRENKTWYSKELIDLIKKECQEAIIRYNNEEFFEDDCDKFLGESFMARRILDIIEDKENET